MSRIRIPTERFLVAKKGQKHSLLSADAPTLSSSSSRSLRRCVLRWLVPATLLVALVIVQRWKENMILYEVGETGTTADSSKSSPASPAVTTNSNQKPAQNPEHHQQQLPQHQYDDQRPRSSVEQQQQDPKLGQQENPEKPKQERTKDIDGTGTIFIDDDRHRAYQLATERALARSSKNDNPQGSFLSANLGDLWHRNASSPESPTMLHLIRIPKAGSSALSVTARALAGCQPDGFPCCHNPKRNKACPLENLECPTIRGCTGHRPNYSNYTTTEPIVAETGIAQEQATATATAIPIVPMITSLRNPVSRAVSAFFYEPPHRPPGKCHTFECFEQDFIKPVKYKNPSTKMLTGHYAYVVTGAKTYPVLVAKRRLCSMAWFGIAEWSLASSLLLYESHPFSLLQPNPVAFGLPPRNNTSSVASNSVNIDTEKDSFAAANLRTNKNQEYEEFKKGVFVERNGTGLIHKHHKHDVEVYQFAVHLFCARVQETAGFLTSVQEANLSHLFKGCNNGFWKSETNAKVETTSRQLCDL